MDISIPFEYILAVGALLGLIVEALFRFSRPWTKPAIAVYATVGAWYLLDFLYNGSDYFAFEFRRDMLGAALIEVIWFLIVYRIAIAFLVNLSDRNAGSSIVPREDNIWRLFISLAIAEIILALIGLVRVDYDIMNLIYPPAAEEHQYLWSRGGVGQGLDFLVSAAGYIHLAVVGMLGVLATMSPTLRLRLYSAVVFLVAMPPFVFQRARNSVLAVVMPGLLAFLLNSRYSVPLRAVVAAFMFVLIYFWFMVISVYREKGHDWSQVNIVEIRASNPDQKQYGLDMLGELCWINTFIDNGKYDVNFGERYFAELVAVIPRGLWPSKPNIGIDYAIARGFGDVRGDAGVNTTIATGMIGQGVVNFGTIFGPLAAGILMALWSRILASLWIQRNNFAKLCLFMLGMGLTFNMGRDITLLVLFPFLFGWIGIYVVQRWLA
jgi:hypothetical protein